MEADAVALAPLLGDSWRTPWRGVGCARLRCGWEQRLRGGALLCGVVLLGVLLAGCASIIPGRCHKKLRSGEERDAALAGALPGANGCPFLQMKMTAGGRDFLVLVPPASRIGCEGVRRDWPAVVLCPELPGVGASVLELAQRLALQGYAVYLPVLWGDLHEKPGQWLGAQRAVEFTFGYADWRAARIVDQRPIVSQLAELCRQIARNHGGKRIGVIGLCLTGSFPVELLAEDPAVPIGAGVVSQPSLPLAAFTAARKASPGFSPEKLARIAASAEARGVRLIGFRFQLDKISPAERFVTLKEALQDRFLDRTLKVPDYRMRDGCPKDAHAVLTDGFHPWERNTVETAGHLAWRRLVWFLDAQLKGSSAAEPQFHQRPRRLPRDPAEGPPLG